MISADRIAFRANGRLLLAGVTLALHPGRLTIVIGPNGAGKSTLVKLLTGEQRASSGTVRLHGQAVETLSPQKLAGLRAVLPQATAVAFPFTVLEIVRMGAVAHGSLDPERQARAALARLGLAAFEARLYPSLSGGEQQRVQFARVLAQMPEAVAGGVPRALFLDEPVASLDLRHQIGVLDVARQFARAGGMVLAVLHDLNLAAEYADHLVVLNAGQIVSEGPPVEALTDAAVAGVYGVSGAVGRLPQPSIPYVLTQSRHR